MEVKLFNRWGFEGIKVEDPGLQRYINLKPIIVPRTFGRHAYQRFAKSELNIVERFINKLMTPGHKGKKHWRTSRHCTGKWHTACNIAYRTFEIIEQRTKQNPIAVLVKAIENAAPREEVTMIEVGGIRVPKAVDTAPQRRVDLALRWITQAAFAASAGKKKSIEECLADEIIYAANNDARSVAINKKIELERQAAASR